MSLAKAAHLSVGDILHIPAEAVDKISVISSEGQQIAKGSLGLNRGHLAVKVDLGLSPGDHASDDTHSQMVQSLSPQPTVQTPTGAPMTATPPIADAQPDEVSAPLVPEDDFTDLPELDGGDFEFPAMEDLPELAG